MDYNTADLKPMFRPDPDFFDSGDSASYHQDLSSIPTFGYPSSPPNRRQHQQSGAFSGEQRSPGPGDVPVNASTLLTNQGSLPLGPPMSTRQNKKQRKSRNNANNRERTVTTLTEDPNTHYLVPTPSEEPAGSHMSAPFSGSMSSGGKMHNNLAMGPPHSYPIQNNFGGYGFPGAAFGPMQHMHAQQQQQQPQQQFFSSPPQQHTQTQQRVPIPDVRPKVPLPPGKNDLEILQNLKKLIIDNQHPLYKAVPSPMSLASLYKGTIPTQSQQAGRQAPTDHRSESADGQPPVTPTSTSGFAQAASEYGERRQRARPQGGKDRRAGPVGAGGNQQQNPSPGNQGSRYNNPPGGNSVGSLNIQNLKIGKNNSGPPSAGLQPEFQPPDLTSSGPTQHVPEGQRRGYEYSTRYSKSESATGDRPSDSSYDNMATDVTMTDKDFVYSGKDDASRPGSWAAPRDMAHSHDDREFDSERTTTPRPPVSANVDARPVGGPDRGPGPDGYDRMQDHRARREEWNDRDRSYPDRGRDTRLTDTRRSSAIAEQRPFEAEYGQPPARRGAAEPPLPPDARHLSENPPAGDVRPPVDARPPPDTRAETRAAPARTNERLGLDAEDIQSSRSSSVRPTDASAPLGSIPPAASGDDIVDDPSVRPSLKERLNPARSSRTPTEVPMGGAGEHPPPHYNQDRSRKPNKYRGSANPAHGGPPYNGPPKGDRSYGRPSSPLGGPPPPMSGGPPPPHRAFNPRSPSVEAPGRKNISLASRGGHRDYRGPGRSVSRDRAGYRPDFHDPRYAGGVDPEAPRYEGRQYREISPPVSGGRGPPADGPPGRDYHQYAPAARREWGPQDDEEYYKRHWDAPPPPSEKARYERDYPPPSRTGGWESRSEREFVARDAYPPGPPGPPADERYPPGPPIRDADRGRPPPAGYAAPFSRVRPRSPTPPRRSGPASVDDSRPPIKRPREDFGPDYYSGGGREPMRRPPAEYSHPPPRSGSQGPPPSSGWAPPGSSAGGGGGGLPGDRDYRMGRDNMDYAPPPGGAYDRRSPGPPGPPSGRIPYNRGGGGYGRGGGEPRERGGYGMQRP